MTGRETYKIWAPSKAKWVNWTRPVPFVAIDDHFEVKEFIDLSIPKIYYLNELLEDTAIIVDLPGYSSIKEGIALATLGYRPIPLFNGTNEPPGSLATMNNHILEPALIWGALELQNIDISLNAPPAFLLDTNRLNRYKMDLSVFDNSWDIFDQDVPTSEYLLNNGITKIIVSSYSLQRDLNKILYKYQKKGLEIYFTNGFEEPKLVKIKKPKKKDNLD